MRPVVDDRPDGFCKLIVERDRRYILGAHVLGEYSAEVVQTASALMAANLRIEQVAELQPAFPTFTEGITIAAHRPPDGDRPHRTNLGRRTFVVNRGGEYCFIPSLSALRWLSELDT